MLAATTPWLTESRARAWAQVLAAFAVLTMAALLVLTRFGTAPDPWQRPLGTDFASFWSAGRLALDGHAALAWNPAAHGELQARTFPAALGYRDLYYAFYYPPPFLLVCAPLAMLPYGVALFAWVLATNLGCFAALRTLGPRSWPAGLAFLAFPAVLLNAQHGQNGALTAGLVATAAVAVQRRPWLAGLCLGAMCVKPQLAVLLGPMLLAARRWDVLGSAALATGVLGLATLLTFGPGAWQGFASSLPVANETMTQGLVGFGKMVSTFAALRLAGAGLGLAWVGQAMVTVAVLGLAVTIAWRRPGGQAEIAVFAAGATLATPFLLDYDLLVLAMPMAWIVTQADSGTFLPWEKPILASAFLLPLFTRVLAIGTGVSVAPLVLAALFAVVLRRAYAAGRFVRISNGISGSVEVSDTSAQ